MTKTKQEQLDEMVKQLDELETKIVEFALENELQLYIEGKGSLLLEDSKYTYKQRGEWYTSTDACS